jgi:hypothetical protein
VKFVEKTHIHTELSTFAEHESIKAHRNAIQQFEFSISIGNFRAISLFVGIDTKYNFTILHAQLAHHDAENGVEKPDPPRLQNALLAELRTLAGAKCRIAKPSTSDSLAPRPMLNRTM